MFRKKKYKINKKTFIKKIIVKYGFTIPICYDHFFRHSLKKAMPEKRTTLKRAKANINCPDDKNSENSIFAPRNLLN